MNLLGWKVKDKITGFSGVATGYITYITGCSQYGIVPESKDGKYPDVIYIDKQRLEVVGKKPVVNMELIDSGAEFMCDSPKH